MRSEIYKKAPRALFRTIRNRFILLHLMLVCIALVLFFCSAARGQAPGIFKFHGVARDASGKVASNANIRVQVTILKGDLQDDIELSEVHEVLTSNNGNFTIDIGSQTSQLSQKDWAIDKFFLQIGMDLTGGNDFVSSGDPIQLVSVPYAIHANEASRFSANLPVVSKGGFNTGPNLSIVGTGSRFIWHPKKAAFRVGNVTSDQWEDSNIGLNSLGLGQNVIAKSAFSVAIGKEAIVQIGSENGIAIGEQVTTDAASVTTLGRFNAVNSGGRLLQIGNGSSEATRNNVVTILKTGMVGIGSNVLNPEYLLDVGNRIRIRSNPELSLTAGIWFNNSSNNRYAFIGGKNDSEVGFFFQEKGWFFNVHENGSAWLAGNLSQNSDRRLKRDFSPLSNSLSKLTSISGQHYFWKDTTKSQELQTGLIAQEVEQYFPELVTTDEKGFKAVNYIGLIPHLIESVKALKTQTETIGVLQKQMQELRAELTNMKTDTQSNQLSK